MMRTRARLARPMAATLAATLLLTGVLQQQGLTALAAPSAGPSFASSFEDGQPQPLVSTVENGPAGPKQQGTAGPPADTSLRESITKVTASAENPPNEIGKNAADAVPETKWLARSTTGTLTYQLDKATAVARRSPCPSRPVSPRSPDGSTSSRWPTTAPR